MAEQKAVTPEQIRAKSEHDRLMAVKVAMMETTNTRGWAYIKKIADNIVQTSLLHSLNVADDTESEQYRIKARVAREIFGQLFTVVDSSLSFGTETEPDWFSELDAFSVRGESDVS